MWPDRAFEGFDADEEKRNLSVIREVWGNLQGLKGKLAGKRNLKEMMSMAQEGDQLLEKVDQVQTSWRSLRCCRKRTINEVLEFQDEVEKEISARKKACVTSEEITPLTILREEWEDSRIETPLSEEESDDPAHPYEREQSPDIYFLREEYARKKSEDEAAKRLMSEKKASSSGEQEDEDRDSEMNSEEEEDVFGEAPWRKSNDSEMNKDDRKNFEVERDQDNKTDGKEFLIRLLTDENKNLNKALAECRMKVLEQDTKLLQLEQRIKQQNDQRAFF